MRAVETFVRWSRWGVAVLILSVALFLSQARPADAAIERVYTLPFYDSFTLLCGFGCYSGHAGVDYELGVPGVGGERVVAALGGIAKPCPFSPTEAGWYIVLDHGDGHRTRYLHMNGPAVPANGASVGRGDIVGFEGNTGFTIPDDYYQLHFETRHGATTFSCGFDGTAVDPYAAGSYMWRTNPPLRAFDAWNLLQSASFEANSFSPWAVWQPQTNAQVYSPSAHSGSYYLQTNTSVTNGSVYQDNYLANPVPAESYLFSVRMRVPTGCVSGTLTLWAIGGTSESNGTPFTLCTNTWTLVSAPLEVALGGHNGLRAQIYMTTLNRSIDVDTAEVIQTANRRGSFEQADYASHWSLGCNPGSMNWARYSGGSPKTGTHYLQTNTATAGASLCQNLAITPVQGESYFFSVWMRSPTSAVIQGTITLWALGGTQESYHTNFTLASTPWVQITAPLDVRHGGHTSLRAEIYLNTTGQNYDLDATVVSKNLFSNGSFELGTFGPWAPWPGTATNVAVYNTPSLAHGGLWFGETNTSTVNGSVFQDVGIQPRVGESYTFTIWARCTAACPMNGSVHLWGTGGNESQGTNFTVGSGFWTPVVVPLDVKQSGHTGLRFQIYLGVGPTLRLDSMANSAR